MKNFGAVLAFVATSIAIISARALPADHSLVVRDVLPSKSLSEIDARKHEGTKNKNNEASAALNGTAAALNGAAVALNGTAVTSNTTEAAASSTSAADKKGKKGKGKGKGKGNDKAGGKVNGTETVKTDKKGTGKGDKASGGKSEAGTNAQGSGDLQSIAKALLGLNN